MSGKYSILVVDDDAIVNDFFKEALTKSGYDVQTATAADAALKLIQTIEFDLILSDVKMPGMNGIELLRKLKDEDPDAVVIMITAHGTVKDAVEAMKIGAFDYVTKPILKDDLVVTVEKALKHRRLIIENRMLREEIRTRYNFDNIVGADQKLLDQLEMLASAAKSRATILIKGESGTGKELIARAIHYNSPRKDGPFVAINCAALPEGLIESELFGHEKGAFTNAIKQTKGKFELADGGTLLLDEVSEIPLGLQAKLLRVIQEREIQRVGAEATVPVDTRIVATTNRELEVEVAEGRFRGDLYYRLNVIPIELPPLRQRKRDIPMLVQHFIRKFAEENAREVKGITERALKLICDYNWPGNIRELENQIERAVILSKSDRITEADLPDVLPLGDLAAVSSQLPDEAMSLAEMEKVMIINALRRNNNNKTKAAEELQITARTLRNKLHEYGMMGNAEDSNSDLAETVKSASEES